MTSNDDMDLLDDDEFPLIKEGSPPPTDMDTNMVFMLPSEFKGAEEEVAQMCLGPKEVVFEKPEESSRHPKPLYIWGHNDGKPISWMLIDGGTTVNLITYSVLKKLGREDDELVKSNLMLNSVGGQSDGGPGYRLHGAHHREQVTRYRILHHRSEGNYSVILGRD
jgi:hypothetical protein